MKALSRTLLLTLLLGCVFPAGAMNMLAAHNAMSPALNAVPDEPPLIDD